MTSSAPLSRLTFGQNLLSLRNATGSTSGTSEAESQLCSTLRNSAVLPAIVSISNHLQDALRDRLVCGIRNSAVCKGLLAEENLDLKKAEQFATAMEIAARDTYELSPRSGAKYTSPLQGQFIKR